MRFPDRETSIGKMIDAYLKKGVNMSDESIHLLYSANRWEKKEIIEKYLNEGKSVICDRYAYSGVAFSMAKGMNQQWCQGSDIGLPRPDLLLFLQITPEAASKRPGFGDERYEESEFQGKVRKAYSTLEKNENYSVPWTYINADRSQEEVYNEMEKIIIKTIDDIQPNQPILPLWIE